MPNTLKKGNRVSLRLILLAVPMLLAGGPGVQVSDSGLTGWAWSENAGWITFSSTGPNPYQIVTSWRRTCTDNNTCPEPTSGTVVS